ncbi:S41 family peptidase [Paenibacillus sophorae]|nr:S41 family peptidase [Paenibacillus sophorae]
MNRMYRKKSILAAALAFLLSAGLLAGCSGESSSPANANVASASPSQVPLDEKAVTAAANPEPPAGNEKSAPLTEKQKLQDFDYMYDVLKDNYPFFGVNKRLHGVDWLANREEYRHWIKDTATDEEFAEELEYILLKLNNGHTQMVGLQDYSYMKGIYETASYFRPWLEQMQKPAVLQRYGQENPRQQTHEGGTASEADSTNVLGKISRVNIRTQILEEGRTAYLGLPSFGMEYHDEPAIGEFLQKVKDYKTLIIDIRGNGGGSDAYWMDFVPMLISKPISSNNYLLYRGGDYAEPFLKSRGMTDFNPISLLKRQHLPNLPAEALTDFKNYQVETLKLSPTNSGGFTGKIYLLVDHVVYSSAEKFAAFAKSTGFATLVGERTGGDGLGMDPLVVALPNSGYVFRFSLQMGLNADGSCNDEVKTVPDYAADPVKTKYLMDDPTVKKVLELAGSYLLKADRCIVRGKPSKFHVQHFYRS